MSDDKRQVSQISRAMKGITASFAALKWLLIVVIICAFGFGGWVVWSTNERVDRLQSRVYVLDKGASFSASETDPGVFREDEIKDNVAHFHELFFNMAADRNLINESINKALSYCDGSAVAYYKKLEESGFYKNLALADAYQQISINRIVVDMNSYPYRVQVDATLWLTRASAMTKSSLVTTCLVENIPRSPKNLHGLWMTNFDVVKNEVLETRRRNN